VGRRDSYSTSCYLSSSSSSYSSTSSVSSSSSSSDLSFSCDVLCVYQCRWKDKMYKNKIIVLRASTFSWITSSPAFPVPAFTAHYYRLENRFTYTTS